jgi:hypothetical protein
MMAAMDRSVAWRTALLFAVALALVAVLLAVTLPRSFFEDWGWLAGPAAWAACALLAGAAMELPAVPVLAGAALSALPSLVAVALDQHWAGAPLGIVLFGAWCGWLADKRRVAA